MDSLTDAAERIGSIIDGRYKIVEVMAAGSMGSVYKAERVPVGKIVAVKFLHASFANDTEFQARFERETRVMSKLNHPNCVSVVDFGVWDNAPYLVMDYVAGETLRAILDKGPIPPPRALSLCRQIAAGLAHAHAQGIVHRDIKPANIMITEEIGHGERVRILDFGLARLRGNVGRDATQTNMVVGTPNYMAPEQTVPSANIDARADIYAVGVVLFEMVVGDRPFHAEDTLQLLGMHRAAPIPRLKDRVPEGLDVPNGLQDLIDKAMAKAPDARYQTAIELADAIDDVIAGKRSSEIDVTIPTLQKKTKTTSPEAIAPTMVDLDTEADVLETPPPRRSRFWRTMLAAMVLVGGAAAMAGYLIHRNVDQEKKILDGAQVAVATIDAGSAGSAVPAVAIDAAEPPPVVDAAELPPVDAAEQGSGSAAGSDLSTLAGSSAGSDVGSAAGSGSAAVVATGSGGSDEIEMDPEKAEDLDPQKGSAEVAVEEAADAPESGSAAEAKAPEPPTYHRATNLHDAVLLIKEGQRELALASLRKLGAENKKSAYIPFLMGNLYADKLWWSAAIDEYGLAIKNNSAYRKNPTLIRNVIRMLASRKTQRQASNFLARTVGHPAIPLLKTAAARDPNAIVKQQAVLVLRQIR